MKIPPLNDFPLQGITPNYGPEKQNATKLLYRQRSYHKILRECKRSVNIILQLEGRFLQLSERRLVRCFGWKFASERRNAASIAASGAKRTDAATHCGDATEHD